MPLATVLTLPLHSSINEYIVSWRKLNHCKASLCSGDRVLRWDKGDTDLYYSMTGHLLYPFYNVVWERVNLNDIITNDFIDKIYEQTVEALLKSSDWFISAIPQHSLKYWWTSDLSNLKKQ